MEVSIRNFGFQIQIRLESGEFRVSAKYTQSESEKSESFANMESKEDFQIFPWSSFQEFKSVANIVLNLEFDSNLLQHIDFLKDLQWTERQLVIWRTKTTSAQHLYEIDATHSIVNCLLHEYLPRLGRLGKEDLNRKTGAEAEEPMNADDLMDDQDDLNERTVQPQLVDNSANPLSSILCSSSSFNLINEETISCLYSNAILKFFKMLSYYDVSSKWKE